MLDKDVSRVDYYSCISPPYCESCKREMREGERGRDIQEFEIVKVGGSGKGLMGSRIKRYKAVKTICMNCIKKGKV